MLVPILWSIVIVLAGVGLGMGIGLRVGRKVGYKQCLELMERGVKAVQDLHDPDPEIAAEAERWLCASGVTSEHIEAVRKE